LNDKWLIYVYLPYNTKNHCMKKVLFCFLLLTAARILPAQDIFIADNPSSIKFYSDAPIADVSATTQSISGAVNVQTKKVFFKVAITSFHFENAKMEEHFNENYMESGKFPNAQFDGVIVDQIDLSKEGQYTVSVKGNLQIHGVTKEVTIPGSITVKDGKIWAFSKFQVKVADYNITVPSAVSQHIAENVDITVNLTMVPYKK